MILAGQANLVMHLTNEIRKNKLEVIDNYQIDKFQDLAEIEKEKGDEYYETISVHTDNTGSSPKAIKSSDQITRIYACCTMWHETKDEMMEFLKSILRLDEDQCARRVAQKYLRVVDPDYYEFESKVSKLFKTHYAIDILELNFTYICNNRYFIFFFFQHTFT